jgi:hypothetical protein
MNEGSELSVLPRCVIQVPTWDCILDQTHDPNQTGTQIKLEPKSNWNPNQTGTQSDKNNWELISH